MTRSSPHPKPRRAGRPKLQRAAAHRPRKTRKQKLISARTLIKRFYPYARPDRLLITGSLLALAAIVVSEMGVPILIRNVIDTFSLEFGQTRLIPILNRISVQYFVIIVAIFLFTFAQNYLMAIIGQRFILRLRDTLFSHVNAQKYSFFNTQPIGKLISRITNDVEGIQELFSNILTGLLRNITTLIGIIITMMFINARLTLFTLMALPIIVPVSLVFNRMLRRASLAVREATSRLTAFISEHISGMQIVQIFSKAQRDVEQFAERNDQLRTKMFREIYTNAVFRPLLDLLSAILVAYVFIISGVFHTVGGVSIGVVVAFLTLITRFFQQLTSIADNFLTIQSGLSGLERVGEVLDYNYMLNPKRIRRGNTITRGVVEFNKVSFGYATEGKEVLRNISFRIKPGETVALVGYTGSGKTTIANLLSRLWDIENGTIAIDGHDIQSIPTAELYRNVAMSGQQIALFDDTIRENIALGTELTEQQIRAAAAVAHADGFIQKLPQAYETRLTNGGEQQLSFGQQQLLTFARIIAHDPKVIILDEATSGIDSETERDIQGAIRSLLADRSALVIAHRLSTVKNADRILVLADGHIIEQGNHTQLIDRKGYYAQLWKYQFAH